VCVPRKRYSHINEPIYATNIEVDKKYYKQQKNIYVYKKINVQTQMIFSKSKKEKDQAETTVLKPIKTAVVSL